MLRVYHLFVFFGCAVFSIWHIACDEKGEQDEDSLSQGRKKEETMSAIHDFITGQTKDGTEASIVHRINHILARMSEPFWFAVAFLLFLAMGPFSVIAVVYGLWSLASGENRERMVEPASC